MEVKQMNKNRQPFAARLTLAFILANAIFLIIFLFTSSISYLNYQTISDQNNQLKNNLEDLNKIISNTSFDCSQDQLLKASEILDSVGIRIGILETRFGKNDRRVLEQKSIYTEIEIKHFELVKKIEEQCQENRTKILFFYSNEKNVEEESDRMGFILSSFKKQNPSKIMIYSFDFNLKIEQINNLKEKYKITTAPIIVLNEKETLYVKNINELNNYFPNQ